MASQPTFQEAAQVIDDFGVLEPVYSFIEDDRYDVTDRQEKRILKWVSDAFTEAENLQRQNEDYVKMDEYINYLMGEQWLTPRPSYRSKHVNNRIWRILWETVANLTDLRPVFEVKSHNRKYQKTADILSKLAKSWWMNSNMDMVLAELIIYSFLGGAAGKLYWNNELRNGDGDMDMAVLSALDFFPLMARGNLQSAPVVFTKAYWPIDEFKRKFPRNGHLVPPVTQQLDQETPYQKPSWMPSFLFTTLSPQMKRVVGQRGTGREPYPVGLHKEAWVHDYSINETGKTLTMGEPGRSWSYKVEPGKPCYPRGRLIVTGSDRVTLYDGPNPHWHGRTPIIPLYLLKMPFMAGGTSSVRILTPMQDYLNHFLAGIMDHNKRALNPPLITPDNAFSDSVRRSLDPSKPGMILAYRSQAMQQPPRYVEFPQLPGYTFEALRYVQSELDGQAGLIDTTEMRGKRQVPSGDTVEQIKESQQSQLRFKGRVIETFVRDVGTLIISDFFQFYDVGRRIFMLGPEGITDEDFDLESEIMKPQGVDPERHARGFTFMVRANSLLSASRVQKALMFMMLRAKGDMSRKHLFDALEIGELSAPVEQELIREIKLMQAGGPTPAFIKPTRGKGKQSGTAAMVREMSGKR